MSFTVYNGYKIPDFSFKDLTKFHQDLSQKMKEAHRKFCLEHVARLCALEIDLITLGVKPKPQYWRVIADMETQFYKVVMNKDIYNLETSVVYFPVEGKILCMFFGMKPFEKIWDKIEGVEEYGYWDNVDSAENCSEEEWELREKEWTTVFKDFRSTPISEGLCSNLTEAKGYLIRDYGVEGREIVSLIPDLDKRVEMLEYQPSVRALNLSLEDIKSKLINYITYETLSRGQEV